MVDGVLDIKNHRFFGKLDWNDLLTKKIKAPFVPKVAELDATESTFLKDRL